jgi:hypothetical protein
MGLANYTMSRESCRLGKGISALKAECDTYLTILTRNKEMTNKDMLSSSFPVINDITDDKSSVREAGGWSKALLKVWHYLKGEEDVKSSTPDPAMAIILQIEDREVAGIVRDLHYRTPKSLQAMRKACEQCFVLPDDCPYYDYSIFDVKKAIKKLEAKPSHTYERVVEELRKINGELAHHIAEYLE